MDWCTLLWVRPSIIGTLNVCPCKRCLLSAAGSLPGKEAQRLAEECVPRLLFWSHRSRLRVGGGRGSWTRLPLHKFPLPPSVSSLAVGGVGGDSDGDERRPPPSPSQFGQEGGCRSAGTGSAAPRLATARGGGDQGGGRREKKRGVV